MLKARIDISLEEYESLKEENQRLNNDIKVLLKENESKEKVIIKYENVLNELENWLHIKIEISSKQEYLRFYTMILDKVIELKESD